MSIKNIIVLLLNVNLAYTCDAQIVYGLTADKERLQLKGSIDTLIQIEYLVLDQFGTLVKEEGKSQEEIYAFDNSQRVTYYKETEDGKLEADIFISHKEDSNFMESKWAKNGASRAQQFKLDDRGNILEKLDFRNDSLIKKEICEYNEKDSLIEYKHYEKGGKLSLFLSFEYDSNNNLINKIYYNNNGWYSKVVFSYKNNMLVSSVDYDHNEKESSRCLYSYDQSNRLVLKITEGENPKDKYKHTYSYDAKGKLLEYKVYDNSSTGVFEQSMAKFYKYDENGRLITDAIEYSNGTFSRHLYEYNQQGNLIQQEDIYNFGKETSKSTLDFEYDERNNWIKKTSRHIKDTSRMTDVSVYVTERIIVYK
jgi:antitoxin component YwqK of YwqJK toxin-antitoxin module